jgi:hypothetical protein
MNEVKNSNPPPYLRDNNNTMYQVHIVVQESDYFDADIFWKHSLVGQIKWFIDESNVLELADLVIFDDPINLRRGCLSFIPIFQQPQKKFRQLGLGTAMLEYVIAQAQELGVRGIYGEVTQDDASRTPYLIDWYQRNGFIIGDKPRRLPAAIATIYRTVVNDGLQIQPWS